jgi:hypothetical protein
MREPNGLSLDSAQLENLAGGSNDILASELCTVCPELRSRGCAVRITDGDRNELYRTPIDSIPPWLKSSRRI